MALFAPSESPAIVVKEVDLTGGVPNVQTTTGAFVGDFSWGPIEKATRVSGEASLVETFGAPTESNAIDFLSANYFLKYSNSLQVVRAASSAAKNAYVGGSSAPLIKNADTFDAGTWTQNGWVAKYAGTLGNSLAVSVLSTTANNQTDIDSDFNAWTYKGSFDAAPGTSVYAAGVGASFDEAHVVVIDQDGLISGTQGTVLETFPYVSLASNAKTTEGVSNYVRDVVNAQSEYVYLAGDSDFSDTIGINDTISTAAASGVTFFDSGNASSGTLISLANGVNSATLGTSDYATGFDLFEDKDTIQVDFIIAPQATDRTTATTIVNDLVVTAGTTRKDCVVVASPARTDIVNSSTPVASAVTTANTFTNSSYLVVDNNYLKVYDKFNDKYRFIPAASSTAGIMAASDLNTAPWFSPAGARRGQYLGITALAYSPTKPERDTLYKAGINPIANLPGQGVLLFGDKTKLNRPSAFDRINVRRLFLVVERAIALAARNSMFEFNDEFTRAEFVNIIEPFLREVKGRRGITDFRVVCDETNNTAEVIDRNEFIANIFIKPARSINYITLNFVAVRTGVDFEEVAGLSF